METSCCWRRWFSTASSTIWRWSRPPPCCPVLSSRRTYEHTTQQSTHTHTNKHLKSHLILRSKQILHPLSADTKQMIPVSHTFSDPPTPSHSWARVPNETKTETWVWCVFVWCNEACCLNEAVRTLGPSFCLAVNQLRATKQKLTSTRKPTLDVSVVLVPKHAVRSSQYQLLNQS